MAPTPLHLQLELRRASDPIEGQLIDECHAVTFTGWLELIAAVEAAIASAPAGDSHEVRPPARGVWS